MPFGPEEFEDFHPYREIDHYGAVLELWINTSPGETESLIREAPELADGYRNEDDIRAVLLEAGVVFVPELPAYSNKGEELPFTQAYYVDKRIGKKCISDVDRQVRKVATLPSDGGEVDIERRLSVSEIKTLVSQAMKELGVMEKLVQMHQEDVERVATEQSDFVVTLGEAEQYDKDTGFGFEEDGPEHLAPRDVI
jgi:hypothetical protein